MNDCSTHATIEWVSCTYTSAQYGACVFLIEWVPLPAILLLYITLPHWPLSTLIAVLELIDCMLRGCLQNIAELIFIFIVQILQRELLNGSGDVWCNSLRTWLHPQDHILCQLVLLLDQAQLLRYTCTKAAGVSHLPWGIYTCRITVAGFHQKERFNCHI